MDPAEVRRVLLERPEIADAQVLGVDDPEWGEVVTAVVVPVGAPAADDVIFRHLEERLAPFKRPKKILWQSKIDFLT